MTKLEHLLLIVAEECGELMTELSSVNFMLENADLVGAIELLKEQEDFDYICLEGSYGPSKEEYEISLNKLQYFIFKALRFGLDDEHPETGIPNIFEISFQMFCLEKYVESLRIDNLEELKEKKKEKILKFLEYSKEKGRLN